MAGTAACLGGVLALAAAGGLVVVLGLAYGGWKTGRLDPQVLSESGKSFRYRWEYWVGSWGAINESSSAFWHGFGPGNFPAAYLRHKLPQASEEIKDPHNFALETWATAGIGALAALLTALAFGLWARSGRAVRRHGCGLVARPLGFGRRTSRFAALAARGRGWRLACRPVRGRFRLDRRRLI